MLAKTPQQISAKHHVVKRRATAADVEIGRRIRSHRMQRGLSQTDLADQCDVTFQQIQKYEKGTNRVSGGRIITIAKALAVHESVLLGTTKPRNGNAVATIAETMTSTKLGVRMARVFPTITSRAARIALVTMAEGLAR